MIPHKSYVGKLITITDEQDLDFGRSGIITDIITNNTECVVLWDNDEENYVDSDGKTCYDMFSPVSVIELDHIKDATIYTIY